MVTVISCGVKNKNGLPPADVLLDCRALPNPASFVHSTPGVCPVVWQTITRLNPLADVLLDAWGRLVEEAAKTNPGCRVAVVCASGQHRSVAVAENIARRLTAAGWFVDVVHRDMKKTGVS